MDYPFSSFGAKLDKDITKGPVKDFNVNPFIVMQKVTNGKYYLTFQNRCYTNQIYPGMLKVDIPTLKEKLNNWLKPSDKKYIKLVKCDTYKSTFVFDIDNWLNDGLKNCKPYLEIGGFNKSYKLGKELPYMFRVNGLIMLYQDFIANKFKENVKKNSKLKKDIFSIVEDVTNKALGNSGFSMFDYKYDRMSNSINVSLKPIFIAGVIASISNIVHTKKTSKRKDFDQLVKKYIKFR